MSSDHRREQTFVVSPGHQKHNLTIYVAEANCQERRPCPTCQRPETEYDAAKRQGREFTEMILERAHGGFWDGLREVLRERGYGA